jgi:hypothetical protein
MASRSYGATYGKGITSTGSVRAVSEADAAIRLYHSLDPARYPVLRKLEVCQLHLPEADRPPEMLLFMELLPRNSRGDKSLSLRFSGVRELKFDLPAISLCEITLLTISSIRSRGWENLNYSVRDEEEESLSFECERFEVSLVERHEEDV